MPEPVADHGKLQPRALLHADLPWPVGPNRTGLMLDLWIDAALQLPLPLRQRR